MNTAQEVDVLLANWKEAGMSKVEIVWNLAQACLGWSYVFGAVGEECTPANRRKYYKNYEVRNPGEAAQIKKKCQVLSEKSSFCDGCPYYPGGKTRCYDCRGFTRWCLGKVGIVLKGAGCTSQWNDNNNWSEKGRIEDLPDGVLACFFHQNGKTMEHTGFCLNGMTIHCSGIVKKGKTTDKGITHYAIPKGLDGEMPVSKPTLRRGDRGEYVTLAQTELVAKGYDIGSAGCDGIFGKATEQAVKNLQKDSGLKQDGIVGPATWAALDNPSPEPTPVPVATLYTVHIPFLTEDKANGLISQYPGSWKTTE